MRRHLRQLKQSLGLRTRLHLMFQRLWLADGDFDEIRNHFGDEVGFYYAWLSHYTTWLGALAPVGITVSFVTGVVSSDNATKVRNICEWDRDSVGNVFAFETEAQLLEHEARCGERRKRGEYPAGGYKGVTAEQRA